MKNLLDVVLLIESCSKRQAREFLPIITLDDEHPDPVPDGFYLYKRGKNQTNWKWVLIENGIITTTDITAGSVILLLGEFAENGISDNLREAVRGLIKNEENATYLEIEKKYIQQFTSWEELQRVIK